MIEHTRQRDSGAGKTKEGREEKVLWKFGACCFSTKEDLFESSVNDEKPVKYCS